MRIAVAGEGTQVTEHFGHCDSFIIFDAENGSIVRQENVPNPGHRPGFLPNFLADRGVNVIISGGMGGGGARGLDGAAPGGLVTAVTPPDRAYPHQQAIALPLLDPGRTFNHPGSHGTAPRPQP